ANLGGTGPGLFARLIELGQVTANASYGWWSLYLDPGGTNIYFSTQTNGATATYLIAPLQWASNSWHLITLTYSSNSSALFIDGDYVPLGVGVMYWPPAEVRTNGFAIGSDLWGTNTAQGTFDQLRTLATPLDPSFVMFNQRLQQLFLRSPDRNGGFRRQ